MSFIENDSRPFYFSYSVTRILNHLELGITIDFKTYYLPWNQLTYDDKKINWKIKIIISALNFSLFEDWSFSVFCLILNIWIENNKNLHSEWCFSLLRFPTVLTTSDKNFRIRFQYTFMVIIFLWFFISFCDGLMLVYNQPQTWFTIQWLTLR